MFLCYKKNRSKSANYDPEGLYSSKALFTYLISGRMLDAFFNQISSSEIYTLLSFSIDFTLLHSRRTCSQTDCWGKHASSSPSSLLNSTYRWELTKSKLGWKSSTNLSNLFSTSISPSLKKAAKYLNASSLHTTSLVPYPSYSILYTESSLRLCSLYPSPTILRKSVARISGFLSRSLIKIRSMFPEEMGMFDMTILRIISLSSVDKMVKSSVYIDKWWSDLQWRMIEDSLMPNWR